MTQKKAIKQKPRPNRDFESLCSMLIEERSELREHLAKLKRENDLLKNLIASLLGDDIPSDKEILAQAKTSTLPALIRDLEES